VIIVVWLLLALLALFVLSVENVRRVRRRVGTSLAEAKRFREHNLR
jgi:hypothetical protein